MNLREAPLLLGMFSSLLPVVAGYLRGRSRLLSIATLLAALAFAFFAFALLRLLKTGPAGLPTPTVYALMASAVPILLASYLVSLSVGRDSPEDALRRSRRTFVYLGLAGILAIALLHQKSFVAGYDWRDGIGTIHLGALGKAYLSYLLVGVVLIGYNIETTYRLAASHVRHHLRLPFLGFFAILAYATFILTTGILYSTIGLGKLIAAGMPIAFANVFIGYGFLRGALTDVTAPVSRSLVYSSFTAIAAGLYVLAVGIVAQLATFTDWSPDEVVTLSFGFLAVLIAVLLLFSNRFQRHMRRFVDKNFYVNRYDYRTQWSNVTQALDCAVERDEVLQRAVAILRNAFLADEISISLRETATTTIRPHIGKGVGVSRAILEKDSPLYARLHDGRRAMLFDRRPDDFEYIPMYAENRQWLDSTASQMVAPLFDGPDLVGVVGLERNHKDDPFTFEDISLLDSIAAHIGSALRSARLAEELAESREMDLVAQWSSMLLHDLKNYLTPLRMVAQNLLRFRDRPDICEVTSRDIDRVASQMEALVRKLSEARDQPGLNLRHVDLDALVRSTMDEMQVERRSELDLHLDLRAESPVLGDESMLKRVLENLVTNAIEAMSGEGKLTIHTDRQHSGGNAHNIRIAVTDAGCGISEDFLQKRLFRPFATTKKGGLGLGLYQSRAIVRAHGGEFRVDSKPGRGTTIEIVLTAAAPDAADGERPRPQTEPSGVTS